MVKLGIRNQNSIGSKPKPNFGYPNSSLFNTLIPFLWLNGLGFSSILARIWSCWYFWNKNRKANDCLQCKKNSCFLFWHQLLTGFFYDCKIFQYYKSDMIILIENLFSKQFLSEPALPQCKSGSRDVLIKSILTCPDPVKGQFILHIINSNNMISNWVVSFLCLIQITWNLLTLWNNCVLQTLFH